jgi:hypothetical protein
MRRVIRRPWLARVRRAPSVSLYRLLAVIEMHRSLARYQFAMAARTR